MACGQGSTVRTIRWLPGLFVLTGLVLLLVPPAILGLTDRFAAQRRDAEVARWLSRPAPAAPPSASVIEPGPDGYLLEVPRIGVRLIVRELEPAVFSGRNTPRLKRFGVGQVPFTQHLRNVSPGGVGTAAIIGHRTTSGAPFRDLDRLRPGDVILIRKGSLQQRWQVERTAIAVPSQVRAIASQPGVRRLALLACNPPFSARERLIVYARPVSGPH